MNSMQRMMFSLLSKPKSATYTVNGYSRKATQCVPNVDFENDISVRVSGATKTVSNNKLTVTCTGEVGYFGFDEISDAEMFQGHKYYFTASLKPNFTNGRSTGCYINNVYAQSVSYVSLTADVQQKIGAIVHCEFNGSGSLNLYGIYLKHWSAIENDSAEITGFNVIDLTSDFGAGNEPTTVEECEAYYGTKYIPFTGSGGTIRKATPPFMFYKDDVLVETYDPQTPVLLGSGESMTFDLPNGITRVIDGNGIELEFE